MFPHTNFPFRLKSKYYDQTGIISFRFCSHTPYNEYGYLRFHFQRHSLYFQYPLSYMDGHKVNSIGDIANIFTLNITPTVEVIFVDLLQCCLSVSTHFVIGVVGVVGIVVIVVIFVFLFFFSSFISFLSSFVMVICLLAKVFIVAQSKNFNGWYG